MVPIGGVRSLYACHRYGKAPSAADNEGPGKRVSGASKGHDRVGASHQTDLRCRDGAILGASEVLLRHGPLRPAQGFGGYRTPVPGLYLSGAGTHPTAGICGIPGQLAAKEVLRQVAAD